MFFLLIGVVVVLTLPGCGGHVVPQGSAYADSIVETMLQALNDGDYQSYSEAFSPDMAHRNPDNVFADYQQFINGKIGTYKSKKLVSVKTDGNQTTMVYDAKFSSESGKVEVDAIFEGSGNTTMVTDFWLNSPKLWQH